MNLRFEKSGFRSIVVLLQFPPALSLRRFDRMLMAKSVNNNDFNCSSPPLIAASTLTRVLMITFV